MVRGPKPMKSVPCPYLKLESAVNWTLRKAKDRRVPTRMWRLQSEEKSVPRSSESWEENREGITRDLCRRWCHLPKYMPRRDMIA